MSNVGGMHGIGVHGMSCKRRKHAAGGGEHVHMMGMRKCAIALFILISLAFGASGHGRASAGGGDRPTVILVHGWLATSINMRLLKNRLERDGFACDDIDFSSYAYSKSIEDYAAELACKIEVEHADDRHVAIVAHSMGGLVSYYYLKNLRTTDQVSTLVTLGTPYHGTVSAKLIPEGSACAQQMMPGSTFLEGLLDCLGQGGTGVQGASEGTLAAAPDGVEIHSIWTPTDGAVIPAEYSVLCGAKNYMVTEFGLVHMTLLANDSVHRMIVDLLKGRDLPLSGPQRIDHSADWRDRALKWISVPMRLEQL